MTKNQSLIVSDFNNDYLINYLRSNKELKKNSFGSLNFENFLSSINELNQVKKCGDIFIITQISKVFDMKKFF